MAYKAFREDPQANPLTTPSGKIEIYSQDLAKIAATWELPEGDVIDPLPIYTPGFENYNDPLTAKYPLQLTGFHYKSRVHSTYGNVDVLKAACRQERWINPIDARKRGIANGDRIRIFNDRGEVHIEAKVTPRMMPGVVALGKGLVQPGRLACGSGGQHQRADHPASVAAGEGKPVAYQPRSG